MNSAFLSAYVIHHRPYRETSIIADVFTFEQGRVSAVVRGVRKAKSDKKSLIQSFQPLHITLSGKSDLKTLAHIEARSPSFNLIGDALYCGLYMNELLMRILPEGLESAFVFENYERSLAKLMTEQANDIVLRHFEFALLEELGVLPDLSLDLSSNQQIAPEHNYYFDPQSGFKQSPKGNTSHCGKVIIAMLEQNWTLESRHLAKLVCRQLLYPFLGGKPLNSKKLFTRRKPK